LVHINEISKEKFEDTEGGIRRVDNTMAKRKRAKRQTMIYKAIHRELKIEQYESYQKLT
jgi:hypothetical protein